MAFALRAGAAPLRPSRPDVRTRAASSAHSSLPSNQAVPTPQGGFPIVAIPGLVLAAAMPIYGYRKCQQEIADARAAQNPRGAGKK